VSSSIAGLSNRTQTLTSDKVIKLPITAVSTKLKLDSQQNLSCSKSPRLKSEKSSPRQRADEIDIDSEKQIKFKQQVDRLNRDENQPERKRQAQKKTKLRDFDEMSEARPGCTRILSEKRTAERIKDPKQSSINLYMEFLCAYRVHLACDICLHVIHNENVMIGARKHECGKNRLVLFFQDLIACPRGILIRRRPQKFDVQTFLGVCEHVRNAEHCPEKQRCLFPHNELERDLWVRDAKGNISISGFIDDLRESSLRVKHVVDHICNRYSGFFEEVCRKCFLNNGSLCKKRRHRPEWKHTDEDNSQCWRESKYVIFEKRAGEVIDFLKTSELRSDVEKEIAGCITTLLEETDWEEIVRHSKRLQQQHEKQISKDSETKHANVLRQSECEDPRDDSDIDSDDGRNFVIADEDNIYDSDFDDLLDLSAFGDDTGDSHSDKVNKSESRSTLYTYFEMKSEAEAIELVQGGSKECVRGIIELNGPFDATCLLNEGDRRGQKIEIRGRKNCGPTFCGDEVVIEKKKTIDTNTGDEVTRGTVIAVTKRNTNRTARTFVCTVDKLHSNSMKPICGTVPKIHIIDTYVNTHFRNRKNNFVAVYDKELKIRKVIKLDAKKRNEMLFVVKYLKWDTRHRYPLGYVCKVMRCGSDLESSQKVINLLYEVHAEEDSTSAEYIDSEAFNSIKDDERRIDYKHITTVTIDPKGCRDIDDALSIEVIDANTFKVAVHIADVSHFIKKGDPIDMNARFRAMSYYPAEHSRPYHMLPHRLSEEMISLVANQERKALSVIFTMNANGEIKRGTCGPGIVGTIIKVDRNLTYEEAQEMIDGTKLEGNISETILKLHEFAVKIRSKRMGDGRHFYEYRHENRNQSFGDLFVVNQCHDAHRLVEEFMILTNIEIASYLFSVYPTCVPLREQESPNNVLLEKWMSSHEGILPLSFYFQQFLDLNTEINNNANNSICVILRDTFLALKRAVDKGNDKLAAEIIGSENLHPLHAMAMKDWFAIQETARYACSDPTQTSGHYSLGVSLYTQFTSPIRSYLNLVVHRLVRAAISMEGEECPYRPEEIQTLCVKASRRKKMAKDFDRDCTLLRMASMLNSPRFVLCSVSRLDLFGINVSVPYWRAKKRQQATVKFSELSLFGAPAVEDDESQATLSWKKRLYDTKASHAENSRTDVNKSYQLDEEMYSKKIDGNWWSMIQNMIKNNDSNSAMSATIGMSESFVSHNQGRVRDVTSEMEEAIPLLQHFVKFSLSLNHGSVVPIQFGTNISNGTLVPDLKLFSLTRNKDICIEHRRHAVTCFAEVAITQTKDSYDSISEYQDTWLPILAMEAATNAAQSEDPILCNNVPISIWKRNNSYYGQLELDRQFCDDRKIKLFSETDQGEATSDYMCIRYPLSAGASQGLIPSMWVCHALMKSESGNKNKVKLEFRICHYNSDPPSEILVKNSRRNLCTVEFLERKLPDK